MTQQSILEERDLNLQLRRCVELYSSGIFQGASIFTQSAFIEILIRLNDLLQFFKGKGQRIDFTDDVKKAEEITDITDLVNKLRNAACHDRTSGESGVDSNRFVFNRIVGKVPKAIEIGNLVIGSEYDDDIAYFYGDKLIYLHRHIGRLLNEINAKLVLLQ
ncbi:hypothetical protein LCGC14_3117390, partial [marine sediment metagenome]